MERCDVLVVGGGPAGSSCAWELQRAGMDVIVLDRKPFPRDKICAGWITPQVVEALELPLEEYAKRHVLQPIHGFRTRRIGGPETRVDYGTAVSFGIRRCEFDDYLLRRSGARLRLGEELRGLRRSDAVWVVNEAIEARALVAAGGHFCPVARRLPREAAASAAPRGAASAAPAQSAGADAPAQSAGADAPEPVVAAQELEFRIDPLDRLGRQVDPELPELFFTEDSKGYGWLVRKGGFLNVGFGRQDTQDLTGHAQRFLAWLGALGRLPALPGKLRGHAYLLHGQAPRPLFGDAVLWVGDAAGLAYPKSGEGIRPAVESGLLAARTLARAGGSYGSDALAPYAAALEARLGPRAGRRELASRLPAAWRRALAGRLLGSRLFARHVVLDRWFLHRHEAALPRA